MNNLSILILAAGEGTRMKSERPKVLHAAAGKPLLVHVLDAAAPLRGAVGVVLGRGAEAVRAALSDWKDLSFFVQRERRGSGDAVKPASAWLRQRGGDVLVLCGDAPLVRSESLKDLVRLHRRERNAATLLTARTAHPTGYGRIQRGEDGRPVAIVEERDAAPEQRRIDEINSGTYIFSVSALLAGLARLRPDNAKGEYYITDVVGDLVARGARVGALRRDSDDEVLGVNNRADLAQAEAILRRRTLAALMAGGVTVVDPASTYVDAGVRVGPDAVLLPQTFLRGNTRVARGACIGPFSVLTDCRVGAGAQLRAVFADGAVIGADVRVGPYAHLRPGTRLEAGVRVGNFVETKNAHLGRGSKANHLTYLGDADVGPEVNIGAGVITCNYDGFFKHRTVVERGAFVGSNVNMVAPVRVGADAIVGAGSTITRDVPAHALALERAETRIFPGWAKRRRAELSRKKSDALKSSKLH